MSLPMLSSDVARFRAIRQVPPSLTYAVAGAGTYYLLFVLPYAFPPPAHPQILSASYVFGFNNKVAILGLIAVITILTFFQTQPRFGLAKDVPEQLAFRCLDRPLVKLFAVASLWYLALTLTIYFVVAKTDGFYRFDWESSHFIWHTRMMYFYGARPYLDFVTNYGPALAYLPDWSYSALRPLGISLEASYYVLHYFLNLIGLAALMIFVSSFAMARSDKRIAFSLVVLSGFSPPMGLSGLLIRYLLPYVGLFWVHAANVHEANKTIKWRVIATTGAISAAAIAVSPEIAIATTAALTMYAICLLPDGRATAVHALLAQAFVLGLAVFLIPPGYVRSLTSFSKGGDNLPIGPAVHIVFYVCILLIIVPRLLAARLFESGANASYACALGIASLAMIPPALGRCDASHVFLNGLGLFTVAFAVFAQSGTRRFLAYSIAYLAVVVVYFQVSNAQTYGISRSSVRAAVSHIRTGVSHLLARSSFGPSQSPNVGQSGKPPAPNLVRENRYAGFEMYDALGLPYGSYGYEKSLQRFLWNQKRVIPEKYMGVMDVYDESQFKERISELAKIRRIVIQKNFLKLYEHRDPCKEHQQYLAVALLAVRTRPCVHQPLDANIEMARFIDSHYYVEAQIGDYLVMQRRK